MNGRRLLVVPREEEFSPGKVAQDRAIIQRTAALLEHAGFQVQPVVADEFFEIGPSWEFQLVLTMCQGERALARLSAFEASCVPTVNRAAAIRSCYRDRMGGVLASAGVPVPYGMLVPTQKEPRAEAISRFDFSAGVYVKRGDLHALTADDVSRIANPDELAAKLASFNARAIGLAYLQQGVPGRVVKFYGVTGEDFFRLAGAPPWLDRTRSRTLEAAARRAAAALGLEVWGGDAVLSANNGNGEGDPPGFHIIDFNDWPSFSSVLEEAASAIARRCLKLVGTRNRPQGK